MLFPLGRQERRGDSAPGERDPCKVRRRVVCLYERSSNYSWSYGLERAVENGGLSVECSFGILSECIRDDLGSSPPDVLNP